MERVHLNSLAGTGQVVHLKMLLEHAMVCQEEVLNVGRGHPGSSTAVSPCVLVPRQSAVVSPSSASSCGQVLASLLAFVFLVDLLTYGTRQLNPGVYPHHSLGFMECVCVFQRMK